MSDKLDINKPPTPTPTIDMSNVRYNVRISTFTLTGIEMQEHKNVDPLTLKVIIQRYSQMHIASLEVQGVS